MRILSKSPCRWATRSRSCRAVKVDYGFASYQSSTQLVGRSLRYTRTLEIKDLSVPVAKANELREFYRIIDTTSACPRADAHHALDSPQRRN